MPSNQGENEMRSSLPFDVRVARAVVGAKVAALRAYCRVTGAEGGARFIASRADWGEHRPEEPTVLCLYRPLFSKDLEQLRKRTKINWVYVNNEFLGHVQSVWAPPELRLQTSYQKRRGPQYVASWKRLEAFGLAVLNRLQRKARIDAVLTSHIDYWQAEGVRLAARRLGIPFLALCREHMCLPIEQESVTRYYTGFRFEGDAVAVFGGSTRDIFVRSGACHPEQVTVTGPPRLDAWRDTPERMEPRNRLVLVSYRDADYRAPGSFAEVLRIFCDMAQRVAHENGTVFYIKAKNREDEQEIRGMAGAVPGNVVIDHKVALHELLPRARLVIGFNSLALVEAQFTTARIVIPYWGDARRPRAELMFDPEDAEVRGVVAFAESRSEFEGWIQRAVADELEAAPRGARMAMIRRIFHFPQDRTCSEEVERFVRRHVRLGTDPVVRCA